MATCGLVVIQSHGWLEETQQTLHKWLPHRLVYIEKQTIDGILASVQKRKVKPIFWPFKQCLEEFSNSPYFHRYSLVLFYMKNGLPWWHVKPRLLQTANILQMKERKKYTLKMIMSIVPEGSEILIYINRFI